MNNVFKPAILSALACGLIWNDTCAQSKPLLASDETPGAHYVAWTTIREKDITAFRRVWEDIDLANSDNKIFSVNNSFTSLQDAITKGVAEGAVGAYPLSDSGRFIKSLTKEEFAAASVHIKSVVAYQIKEDSLHLANGDVTVRIVGLAPMVHVTSADGAVTEEALFWVYYPDSRIYLSKCSASKKKTWDDIFEERRFASHVVKVHDKILPKIIRQ